MRWEFEALDALSFLLIKIGGEFFDLTVKVDDSNCFYYTDT